MKLARPTVCMILLLASLGLVPPATAIDSAPAANPFTAEAPLAESGITLAELEAIALGNNPTLVQAAMRVRAARGKSIQAKLYPNPFIGYRGEEIGVGQTAG